MAVWRAGTNRIRAAKTVDAPSLGQRIRVAHHSRRKSGGRKLPDLKNKGNRITPFTATHRPRSAVHFIPKSQRLRKDRRGQIGRAQNPATSGQLAWPRPGSAAGLRQPGVVPGPSAR